MKKITYECDQCRFSTADPASFIHVEILVDNKSIGKTELCSKKCAVVWLKQLLDSSAIKEKV